MSLIQLIEEVKREKRSKRWTFTLEPGRGQTYCSGRPTLYAHNVYPRSSVLAGQPVRRFLEQWETWDEARKALSAIPGLKYRDEGPEGGSSHIDVDVLTAHLPDEGDL
jgi:hypothetical protein